MANIKVAVRVRPISARELNLTGSEVVVCAESHEISLTNLKISSSKAGDSRERIRKYGFDYCFDSSDPKAKNYATQAMIYETLGQSILDALFAGYNSCLVAYGQSASGKTYTMMGTKEDPGLIPRLCEGIFSKVEQESGHERIYRVTVSYLEIYNEKVRDLLKPSTSASGLRVREHPRLGPYVQGLTHHVVRTLGSLMSYVEEGTKARKTASTLQNPSSSRSHALLTVDFSQDTADAERPGTSLFSRRQDTTSRGGSRLHLVDLAGSESAATCGGVHRLKEGANINKSLVALGNVISALAERGSPGSGPGRRYIPYRDSSLTWLLKDALGGNATTIMLATISPASGSYNETAHTLRFAQRAQSVVNRPVVNEDPVGRLIRELKAEVARLKSLLLAKDIDQQTKAPCSCNKVQSSKDSTTDSQYCGQPESLNTSQSDRENESIQLKDKSFDVFPIRRFNSSDSVNTYETGSSRSIRKFNSYEHLQSSDRFADNYNQAKITELNEEEDEVVNEINEPVFVDIPTLVAVLIKPDDNLQQSSTQIEEICSDEVQEDSIDVDFIQTGNEEFDEPEKIDDIDPAECCSNSTNSCNALDDSEIGELRQIPSECPPSSSTSVENSRSRGKFSKQNSIDLPSSNLNTSTQFGSIERISKKKEPTFGLQRSHTNLEKRPALPDRGKKLNNIREIDDRKTNAKSGNIWKAIGNVGSKDHLQRKSSNESDKSLKDSNSGKTGSYSSIGRKPSLENLKRKTSKDSSSSSSKEEQILISSLTRDKFLSRKNSLDQEAAIVNGVRHHTTIQRVKRADIVAAVTERLYSSRKHIEETSMATGNASDTRSPPEGTDVKISSNFMARARLQEISRKMLMKRRRINADTQTEAASTLRFKDTACLTDEPKIVLQDAAVLTDDHMDCDVAATSTDHRLPVLRVKDVATLTDRRPRTNIFRCKDAESLVNDLDFDDYELHSPRNDSGVPSDDTRNYAESNLFFPDGDRRAPYTDSSTNTFLVSPSMNSSVQTARPEATSRRKENPESRSCSQCCSSLHECNQQHAPANNLEKNVISISLPDMISITIESTNGLESRIAVMDGNDATEERMKPVFNDKECQTDQLIKKEEVDDSLLNDLTVRSTATQADGRVFRIENIFQDPKSKSCDVVSDLKKETKSVIFRNSLGTSSVIETKDNGTETEWKEMHVENIHQRKCPISKGSLTRAFIAKRRSYNLSPRRPIHRLAHHNVWKNWTLPCPGKFPGLISYGKKMRTALPSAKKDTDFPKNLPPSINKECTLNNEKTLNNEELEETIHKSSSQTSGSSFKNSKKSKSAWTNNLLNYDCNFSDDSLDDEDDVARKSDDVKAIDSNDHKYYESFCPPDVVAHTKKEVSKSTYHVDSANVESPTNDDFDDTEIELPKRKPVEILDKSPMQDYKELISGTSSYVIDNDSEKTNTKMNTNTNHSDNVNRKKVSFLNLSSSEEITDTMSNRETSVKQTSEIVLKSIIKKMEKKKLAVTENLDIVQPNTETDQFLQQKKTASTKSEEVLPALKEKENSKDSENPSDIKVESFNENHLEESFYESDSVTNKDTRSCKASKKNILEEYLNEATIFMRNMNSMNEYMNATNVQSYGKRHIKSSRNNRRGNNPNKDCIEIRGRKISLKNDIDKYPQSKYEDEIIAIESYEKCLRGIKRLEACIDKTNKHNQVLRDRYGIGLESAGAKSSLANPSVDSSVFSINDSAIRQHGNVIPGIENCDKSNLSTTSLPLLSSIRTKAKQSMLNEIKKFEAVTTVNKCDSDYKNNNITPEDDLEREIFDQLMRAVDSSKCLSFRQTGRLPKMSDLGSRSPTTYSKFRKTFRQDACRILNFDQVSAIEDYLGDIRAIESSPQAFRKMKLSDPTDIDSGTSIDSEIDPKEFCNRNELSEENSNLLKIDITDETRIETKMDPDCSIDSVRSIDVEQTSYTEEIERRRSTQKSKDRLRMESMNFRFGGPLSIELKYPSSPRAKFLELLRERRRIVEKSRGTNAF